MAELVEKELAAAHNKNILGFGLDNHETDPPQREGYRIEVASGFICNVSINNGDWQVFTDNQTIMLETPIVGTWNSDVEEWEYEPFAAKGRRA